MYVSIGKWPQCLKTILQTIYKKFATEAHPSAQENHISGHQHKETYIDEVDVHVTEESAEEMEVRNNTM